MAYALYVLLYASGHFLGSNWVNYAGAVLVLWIVYLSGSFRWEKEPAPLLAFFLLLWPSFGTVFGVSEHVFLAWFKHSFLLSLFLGARALGLQRGEGDSEGEDPGKRLHGGSEGGWRRGGALLAPEVSARRARGA